MKAKPVKADMAEKLNSMTFDETISYIKTNVVAGFKMFPAAGQAFDALLDKLEGEYKALEAEKNALISELSALKGENVTEEVEETKEGE